MSFPPCFALRFLFKLTQPLTVSTVQLLYTANEKGGKPDKKNHTPFHMVHIETSSLKTLKIIPRNLNEIG
jgi:hypothetical protein